MGKQLSELHIVFQFIKKISSVINSTSLSELLMTNYDISCHQQLYRSPTITKYYMHGNSRNIQFHFVSSCVPMLRGSAIKHRGHTALEVFLSYGMWMASPTVSQNFPTNPIYGLGA